jgi:hypothetical protein
MGRFRGLIEFGERCWASEYLYPNVASRPVNRSTNCKAEKTTGLEKTPRCVTFPTNCNCANSTKLGSPADMVLCSLHMKSIVTWKWRRTNSAAQDLNGQLYPLRYL